MFTRAILVLQCFATAALAATYDQADSYSGEGFISGFFYDAIPDPTHGRVYVPLTSSRG